MTRLLILLLALITATPAIAAERSLLAPRDLTQSVAATASAAVGLATLRDDAARTGRVRVIIGLRVAFAAEMALAPGERALQRAEIAGAAIGLRARFSAAVARSPGAVRSYAAIPFMVLEVNAAELERLARDRDVISLAPDILVPLSLKESTRLVRAPEAWALGYSGLGQSVAILDTGVDKAHPFLAGKVVSEACYSQGGFCPGANPKSSTAPGSAAPCPDSDSECRHGTHVAGIVAGKGSEFSGVARDASLIAIQVFSPLFYNGRYLGIAAWSSDIVAGLNRVYELRGSYRIAAVNLSLGGRRFTTACDSWDGGAASFAAIATLRAAGIATVAASGNDGYTDALNWPACFSSVVSVGAVHDSDWGLCNGAVPAIADKVACFSNTSPFLSLLAPGAVITSSVPGGGYGSMAGTSMAAPHVAGAFAVLRQKYPGAPVSFLLARLQNSGHLVADDRAPAIVKPRIDVAAALAPVFVKLNVVKAGSGGGSLRITAPGLSQTCAASCTVTIETGTQVSVTALPAPGSQFAAWSGACSGTGACRVVIAAASSITATFAPMPVTLTYEKLGKGQGSVSFVPGGGAASCSASCTQRYKPGTNVKLTAAPARAMKFTAWSGACTGSGACVITMAGAKSVRASFAPK